jgi:amino acid transporter
MMPVAFNVSVTPSVTVTVSVVVAGTVTLDGALQFATPDPVQVTVSVNVCDTFILLLTPNFCVPLVRAVNGAAVPFGPIVTDGCVIVTVWLTHCPSLSVVVSLHPRVRNVLTPATNVSVGVVKFSQLFEPSENPEPETSVPLKYAESEPGLFGVVQMVMISLSVVLRSVSDP